MKVECKLKKYNKYSDILEYCVNTINKHVSSSEIQGIDRITFLDNNEDKDYSYAGGMYYLQRNNEPPCIVLYIEQILHGMPKIIPKKGIFLRYAIIKMLLHEIGHHVNRKYAYERDRKKRGRFYFLDTN